MCLEAKFCEFLHLKVLIAKKFASSTVRIEIIAVDRCSYPNLNSLFPTKPFSDIYKNRIGDDVARAIRFKALVGEYCVHLLGKKNRVKERANI